MKKVFCSILIICLLLTSVPFSAFAAGDTPVINPESYPDFTQKTYGALYAHATVGGDSASAWQRWHKDEKGVNFENGVRYFFLPKSADDNKVEIYNNYGDGAATIGDTVIEPYTSAVIDYEKGKKITATLCKDTAQERDYTFVVYKSDAEASVFVNDTTNSYEDYQGKIQNTDLWSFLIQNKENSVADSACSIADENGVFDTTLKKIKGRGNTNWKETDKKPFNLTFYDKTSIGGVTDKKFSFVSNAKDSTLVRNSVMYDFADNVGSKYSSDQSFIDFYVNGVYRGSYIACQKIDLGKNSVVSLKDESDDMNSGFNFLVEVDVWNYASDVYFVSDKGYHVVLKTPDLDDYDENDPDMKAKYDYIKDTYQRLEDALYDGTLSDIEKICDLDSLATQYLLQEFGKNCDGGYTSTFFTYNAAEDKFYAAPIWDCDSCLGAVDCVRDNCKTSTIDHKGWTTRLAKYEKTINPLGQPFYVSGTSNSGQTFEDLCKEIWHNRFLPNIDIMLGKAEATGRLKSIDTYVNSIEQSAYNNYVMWDFMWLCASKNKTIGKKYSADYNGEVEYLKDWVEARADWISNEYKVSSPDIKEDVDIFFSTDLGWDNVHYYIWASDSATMKWPGEKASFVTEDNGKAIYKATIPSDTENIIFNNGSIGEQTADIKIAEDYNYYYTTTRTGKDNQSGYGIYNIAAGKYQNNTLETTNVVTTAIAESTATITTEIITDSTLTAPAESTSIVITTATVEPTESTSIVTEPTESTSIVAEPTESTSIVTEPTETTSIVAEPTETTCETTSVPSTATEATETLESTVAPTTADLTSSVITTSTEAITTVSTEIPTTNSDVATTAPAEATFPKGDANKDLKVNIKDVTTIQKHVAKFFVIDLIAQKVADVNNDSKITISDATTLQKFIAGLISWDK